MHIYIWNGSDAVYLVAFFSVFFFFWAHRNIIIIFSSRDHDVWLIYSYIIQCVEINDQRNISMLLLQLAVFFFFFIWYSIRNIYWPAKRSKWHRTLDSDLSRSTYIKSLRHSDLDHTHHMFVVHCYRKSRRQNGVCLVFFFFSVLPLLSICRWRSDCHSQFRHEWLPVFLNLESILIIAQLEN